MHLSKSRFTSGLQCHRQLWWRVHEPDAPELVVGPAQQALFEQGHRVGAEARTRFPGGVLVDAPYRDFGARVEQTRRALATGAPAVFEAAFLVDDLFVAVDVLERTARGHAIVEVKSSTKVKPEHLPDATMQAHVAERAGLAVERVEVMHLNRECRHPDLSNLFTRADVTHEVRAMLADVPAIAASQLRMLARGVPDVETGPHCHAPYECPFLARCWPPAPEHAVGTLYKIGARAAALESRGYATIGDLPDDFSLSAIQARQRRAIREGRRVVEPGLADALARLAHPCAVLDFETVAPAIPVWHGCRPYDAVPAQFSVHLVTNGGAALHHQWIAEGPGDPRPALAEALIEACRDAATVVAYNAPYEKGILRHLAEHVPRHARELLAIESRTVDALPLVRDYVYDPAFDGGFGLKQVLPVLVPELSYEGLEISDGDTASRELARLLLGEEPMDGAQRARTRAALLRYCALDTLGVVRLLERLRALAR